MQRQYNKNIRFYNYKVGDKVWVKMKYYKVGEHRKLSPRRSGPWTIREKLPNGLNFKVTNDSSKSEKIIHHDRLSPAKAMPSSQRNYISEDGVHDSTGDEEDLSSDNSEESDNDSTADGNQSSPISDTHSCSSSLGRSHTMGGCRVVIKKGRSVGRRNCINLLCYNNLVLLVTV